MTATATLKLPAALKARIASAADAAGKTPHAFVVEALEAQIALAERRRAFVQAAMDAEQEVAQYGLVYDADEVFSYLRDKLQGRKAEGGYRERVLSHGRSGYLALDPYNPETDTALVLAIRHPRDHGHADQ